jgi:hypothetical protein
MSVVQACAQAEVVIERARSLFATAALPPAGSAAGGLATASQATAATAQRTADNSGVLTARHKTFANTNTATLSGAGHTEAALDTQIARGAALTQTGAQRLDAIATQTRATAQTARTARTPAAQRVILTALRAQVAQAQDVVNTATTQAGALAAQIRALKYPLDRPEPAVPGDVPPAAPGDDDMDFAPPLYEPPFPAGPIVWCVRPQGTFGFWRCSVLYPDLSVGTYWSPTDDSGGSLP